MCLVVVLHCILWVSWKVAFTTKGLPTLNKTPNPKSIAIIAQDMYVCSYVCTYFRLCTYVLVDISLYTDCGTLYVCTCVTFNILIPSVVFGVDLTIIVKMYNTKTPVVLKHCISEVEKRGQ